MWGEEAEERGVFDQEMVDAMGRETGGGSALDEPDRPHGGPSEFFLGSPPKSNTR